MNGDWAANCPQYLSDFSLALSSTGLVWSVPGGLSPRAGSKTRHEAKENFSNSRVTANVIWSL